MVLEVAVLQIKKDKSTLFERDFQRAEKLISSADGYIKHDLVRCLEQADKYLLLVQWETLEDHTVGFRGSPTYQEWKELLHHYYDPFPVVEHYV